MEDQTKHSIKGLLIGLAGVMAGVSYMEPDMGLLSLTLTFLVILLFVTVPIIWPKLEASPEK